MLAEQSISVLAGNEFLNTTLPWTVHMGTCPLKNTLKHPFPGGEPPNTRVLWGETRFRCFVVDDRMFMGSYS